MRTIFVVENRFDGLNFILTSPVPRVSSNRAPIRCSGWGRRPPRRQEAEVQRHLESISGEPRWRSYSPRAHEWQENKLNDVVGVTAGILRDTCAVRQLKRGEGMEKVLTRLGLSKSTWEDAKVKYEKLSRAGI
jgi:hypothetical protein